MGTGATTKVQHRLQIRKSTTGWTRTAMGERRAVVSRPPRLTPAPGLAPHRRRVTLEEFVHAIETDPEIRAFFRVYL